MPNIKKWILLKLCFELEDMLQMIPKTPFFMGGLMPLPHAKIWIDTSGDNYTIVPPFLMSQILR